MSLKKIKAVDVFGIFILSVGFHFIYNLLPNPLFAWIFPVNESIWEHMKLFFTSTLLWGIVDHYLLKKHDIPYNNFLLQLFLTAFLAIPLYLIIFLPVYNKIGENMFFSISLMFIVYIISQFASYKLLTYRELEVNKYFIIALIVAVYAVFIYLTYKPIRNYIFYDKTKSKYGLNKVVE